MCISRDLCLMAGAATTVHSHFAPLFLLGSGSRQQSWAHHSAPDNSRTLLLLGRTDCSSNRIQIADLQFCSGHRGDMLSCVMRANGNGVIGEVNSADAEDSQEEKNGLTALQQLDSQLRVLSQTDEAHSTSRTSSLNGKPKEIQPVKDSSSPTTWPEFSEGFFAYVGIGLLILTVINNVLYRLCFGPPPIKPKVFHSSELRTLRIEKFSGNLEAPLVSSNSK
ncbi:hypothetical protein O6H91_Y097900 [Diphasiastrum complanatum]|nr:hypothetical protein O6H91_Y097900 [Diphasiastrum complanatum]